MKATLSTYRQSPRKVRLIADLIRGERVDRVLGMLDHVQKRAALPMKKLVASALANAKQSNASVPDSAYTIDTITVDKGRVLKRFMPRARGRASSIHKHTSHITVELGVRS